MPPQLGVTAKQLRTAPAWIVTRTALPTNSAGKGLSMFVDETRLGASVHRTNTCASCHANITSKHPDDNVPAEPPQCAGCHEKQSESYQASVHGLALARGQKDSATCSDCHDGHTILPPSSPESPLHFWRLAQTCGACHEQAPPIHRECAWQSSRGRPSRRPHLHRLSLRAQIWPSRAVHRSRFQRMFAAIAMGRND